MKNKFRPKPISKQVIVITGASSGIGLETARLAAEKGASVVMCSRNLEELKKIESQIKECGFDATAIQADVTQFSDLKRVKDETIRRFGRIDTWVNNAGVSIYGRLIDLAEEEERKLFETNFWGLRHGCRIAVEAMRAHGGVIINLGSEASGRSIPLQGMYSATKHAVKAYTDALRIELAHDEIPIQVSLIRPTAINTLYAEHAANRLQEGSPSLPDPIYDPVLVAEAILNCAEYPRRDAFVGLNAKLATLMDALVPGVADRLFEQKLYREQTRGTAVPHQAKNEALHRAPLKEGKARGAHVGKSVRGRKHRKPLESSAQRH